MNQRLNPVSWVILVSVPLVVLGAVTYPYILGQGKDLCAVHYMLGLPCPGCGFTRSIVALVHGDVVRSIRWHPMGIIAMLILSVVWLRSLITLGLPGVGARLRLQSQSIKLLSQAFVAGLFVQWLFYLGIRFWYS